MLNAESDPARKVAEMMRRLSVPWFDIVTDLVRHPEAVSGAKSMLAGKGPG
jgi:hypothetical protein